VVVARITAEMVHEYRAADMALRVLPDDDTFQTRYRAAWMPLFCIYLDRRGARLAGFDAWLDLVYSRLTTT